MKRWKLCLVPAWLAACSPGNQDVAVVPEPVRDSIPVALPTPDREPVFVPPADTQRQSQVPDSVRDEEMLERLHEVSETAPDSSAIPEADLASMFDINVARYAEHDRVKFYLRFFQGPARERMTVWLGRMPTYLPMNRSIFAARGLPLDLAYLALIESGYSNTAVSRSKATGMWQFMRGTAKQYGLRVDPWVDERRDPVKSAHAAARFLTDLKTRFGGSAYLAAAAYNSGGGTVSRGLRKLGSGAEEDYFDDEDEDQDLAEDTNGDDRFFHLSDSRFLRRETKDYVPKLIAAAMIAKQPEKYGFPPIPEVEPYQVDSVPVTEPTSLEVVARAGGLSEESVVSLNRHFIRGITPPEGLAWVRVPVGEAVAVTEALAAVPSHERVTSLLHQVARRETLRSIARRYGVAVSEVVALNPGLSATSRLATGTNLRVPGRARVRSVELAAEESSSRAKAGAVHRVRSGETLGAIARRYGVSLRQIYAWNDVGPRSKLRVGQRLRVGPGKAVATTARAGAHASRAASRPTATHLVRRGETMGGIARRYRVSLDALLNANGMVSAKALKAGVRLRIPRSEGARSTGDR